MDEGEGSAERMGELEPESNAPAIVFGPAAAVGDPIQQQQRRTEPRREVNNNSSCCRVQQIQSNAAAIPADDEGTHASGLRSTRSTISQAEVHGRSEQHGSNVIPGVEHVFFEQELEKMEQQTAAGAPAGHDIIVLAVDNSKPSDMAFQFYVDNVSRSGYFLHVVHHSNYWGNYEPMDGGPSPKHCQELMEKEASKVTEIEAKYRALMDRNHIAGDFICLRGKDTWHDIIQHQESVNAIMIVMGTRGQNTLRRTFMGSVSDSVVHHASCPVLVCCHPKH